MQNQDEEFDKLTNTPKRMKLDSEDEDGEGLEDLDLENEEDMDAELDDYELISCDICEKFFATKESLKNHIKKTLCKTKNTSPSFTNQYLNQRD